MDDKTKIAMQEAEEIARGYFKEGLNCSECVFRTFLDTHETGLPDEVIGLSSGFGGGIGRTRNTCGAITGAILSVGAAKGRKNPMAKETLAERASELKEVYSPFTDLIREIESEYGTISCKELSAPHGEFDGKERKKNCQQIIGYCAALAAKYSVVDDTKTSN